MLFRIRWISSLHHSSVAAEQCSGVVCHAPWGAWSGCWSPCRGPWARRRINHWILWRITVQRQTYGYLPSLRASPPSTGTKFTVWLQRRVCEQRAWVCYMKSQVRESNWRPLIRKSSVLSIAPPGHAALSVHFTLLRHSSCGGQDWCYTDVWWSGLRSCVRPTYRRSHCRHHTRSRTGYNLRCRTWTDPSHTTTHLHFMYIAYICKITKKTFIELSLTLTTLCHMKREQLVSFYISL